MIEFTISKNYRPFLYQITLKNLSDIQDDLDQELQHSRWEYYSRHRSRCRQPSSFLMRDILSYLLHDEVKLKIINHFWSNDPQMQDIWLLSAEDMHKNTIASAAWIKDSPGWDSSIHLDPRLVVIHSWIYFHKNGDDRNITTEFYLDEHKLNPLVIETGFGKGWVSANVNNCWHQGWNHTDNFRYSLSYHILLSLNQNTKDRANPYVNFNDDSLIKTYFK